MDDTKPWVGTERRRHRRVGVRAPASLVSSWNVGTAECVDLSMGGAGLLSDATPPSGSKLKLELHLGPGRRVIASAEVVRSCDGSVGIRFVQLDPKSMAAILSMLQ